MKDPSVRETELAEEIAALKKRVRELELSEAERIRVEEELVVSRKRLSRAEIISRCGNWEFDLNLNRVFASEGAFSVYGLPDGKWSIPEVQKIPLPEYRPMLDEALRGLVSDNHPYNVEFRIKRPDTGEIIDIHSVAEYDRHRNVVFGVIQDITDRKRADEALKESEARLNTILSNVGAYIYLKDTQYRYTYVNNKVCSLFGVREDEITGKGDASFFSPVSVEEIMRSDGRVIEQGETITREETDLVSSDNCPRTYWVVKLPLKDIHGNISGLCGISTDITDLKRAEQALKEAKDYSDNLVLELREALDKVKTLSGFLPICSSCKKIRNDKGQWEEMEVYIRDRSEAEFSHGICPECAKRLYPGLHEKT